MAYWGRFNAANPTTLPISSAFLAANGREWLLKFWQLEGVWVGIACPFGIALWVLFFFDHNVSVHFSHFIGPISLIPRGVFFIRPQ
jgi:hypothetical protein